MISLKAILLETNRSLDRRYDLIQAYMNQMVASAPGNTREEKIAWVWKDPVQKERFQKLYNGLKAVQNQRYKTPDPGVYRARFFSEKYFIRFGDLPEGGRSMNHLIKRKEKGISAYAVNWSEKHGKWELDSGDLSDIGMSTLDSMVADFQDNKGRPIYLLQAIQPEETGIHDDEPLLKLDDLKVVKKLDPAELYIHEFGGDDWWK